MYYPILEALQRGEKFPSSTLISEFPQVQQFWEWWWQQVPPGVLVRPYTVIDGDPLLQNTNGKSYIDTETHRAFMSPWAIRSLNAKELPSGTAVHRPDYRRALVDLWTSKGEVADRPRVVLAGGGYGAGKTTVIDVLNRTGRLSIGKGCLTGVDYFKAYLTEFSVLQMLADGNASTLVQDEARQIAHDTFIRLVGEHRSFGWDSSLSNLADSLRCIRFAKANNYHVTLVAVFAPLERAIAQAMSRARKGRRFAHPEFLPKSHVDFRANFASYVPLVDELFAFVNDGAPSVDPHLVARKVEPNAALAIYDQERFSKFVG